MKIRLNQKTQDKQERLEALCEDMVNLQNKKAIQAFLMDLCTPAELEAMADRWQVVHLLMTDLSYREIHQKTGVSVTTIGRVARFLEQGNGGYQLALGLKQET